jgi:ABC-type nitrate/sulfonate/bicarbonate transport system permease component
MKSKVRAVAVATVHAVALPLLLIAAWYVAERVGLITTKLLPGPQDVFGAAAVRIFTDGQIYQSIAASVQRVFAGWLIAVLVGVSVGLAASLSRRARLILEGPISACRPLPPAALVPLAILWLGIGDAASIALVAFVAVWPVLINTMVGIENVPRVMREAALTMGATTRQLVLTVLIPASLPSVVLGMRLAMGLAWMSVVLSELVGVKHGVGAQLLSLQQNDDVAAMLLLVLLIGVLGLFLDWLFRVILRPMTRSNKALLLT